MCFSSGGNTGTTRYEWNEGVKPYWEQLLGMANYEGNLGVNNTQGRPYTPYPGERVADLTNDHWGAMQNIRNIASNGPFGNQSSADANQAREQAFRTSRGDYLGMNPFGGNAQQTTGYDQATGGSTNPFAGKLNPWAEMYTGTGRNQFGGDNPHFRQTLQTGLDDITQAYKQGTGADTTRLFNLSGAFGGSAHQNAVANNENALGKQLGNFANGMLNQQYDRSAGLEESFLGRDLQNQQYNKTGSSGMWESMFGRGFQGGESALDRQFQSDQGGTNRDWQGFENERGRMMQSIPLGQQGQQMDFDRYNQILGVGDIARNREQQYLDQYFNDWTQQQNYGRDNLTWLASLFGAAQGGAPPSSFSQIQSRSSPIAPLLGGLGLGSMMFG